MPVPPRVDGTANDSRNVRDLWQQVRSKTLQSARRNLLRLREINAAVFRAMNAQ
jgi:hypothetical protein